MWWLLFVYRHRFGYSDGSMQYSVLYVNRYILLNGGVDRLHIDRTLSEARRDPGRFDELAHGVVATVFAA